MIARIAFAVGLAGWCLAAAVAHATTVERRIALVIGNGAYTHATALPNPVNDARLIGATLKGLGFQVIEGTDLNRAQLEQHARDFAKTLASADTAVFFYAGHGIQVAGRNYLLPVEAKLDSERDLQFEAVAVDVIIQQMELDRQDKTSIVFLDACRDNPLARNLARSMGTRSAALGRGLAQIQSGMGTFISYATQPGNVALDGDSRNSPFTSALARHMASPGKGLTGIMFDVRKDVVKATDGQQVPWDHSSLLAEFYFTPRADVTAAAPTPPANADEVASLKERMKQLEEQLARQKQSPPAQKTAEPASQQQRESTTPAPKSAESPGCVTVPRVLNAPIKVTSGDELCASGGRERARVIAVRDNGIIYATEGQRQTFCKPGQRCSFNWVGAPIFTTRIVKSTAADVPISGEFLPLN